MAKEKGKEVEIPQSWRESIARHLAAWVERQPAGKLSQRAIAKEFRFSHFSYNRLMLKKGPVGIDVLVKLRAKLRVSLDELLGLDVTDPIKPADTFTAEDVRAVKELTARTRPSPPTESKPDAPPPPAPRSSGRRVLE